ncbi:hypothetical protein FVE85_4479 [Porphyridium purpureum]|uniref:Uncharacterized protein n=1 Tax=Porphyridium purpureum TaxID=35688 RepID=A0A5J4YJ33_PORPP|nr:hypothetical protein FVE85_4479 [Porphyridium purpureum]|eukprot:POR9643..scf297_16
MAFVAGAGGAFVGRASASALVSAQRATVAARAPLRRHAALSMMDDMDLARKCAEEGCKLEDVQMVLTRLEVRRKELDKEANEIASLMAQLAKTSMVADDTNELQKLVESAMRIFSKTEDDFPLTGEPLGYTMDKPKSKRR